MIELDGHSLTLEQIDAISSGGTCRIAPAALEAVARGATAMREIADSTRVYGRNTGVGANRDHDVAGRSSAERAASPTPGLPAPDAPGRLLLRSHAGGWGAALPPREIRALSAIRANQLLSGTSGASVALPATLLELLELEDAELPLVHAEGSIGTGDLPALAELGLGLLGERPRRGGRVLTVDLWHDEDALPLMSSGALTLALAAQGALALHRLSRRALSVYALTHLALGGNRQAVGPVVELVTPFDGAREVARTVRDLLEPTPAREPQLQDFFGLRCFPQVHGPLLDELVRLRGAVEALANTESANPAVLPTDPPTVAHHGGFHLAHLSLRIDATQLALAVAARSVVSRLSHLLTDPVYGLPRFLAGSGAGDNGLLVLEYSAAAALERLRALAAAPHSLGTAHLSAGIEDDASQAAQAAARLAESAQAYRHLLAFELVAAARALRLTGVAPRGPLGSLWEHLDEVADDPQDHDPAPDIASALAVLDGAGPWP